MFAGFAVYFYYGIKHSSLEEEEDLQNIELSVTNVDVEQAAAAAPRPQPTVSVPSQEPYMQSWDSDQYSQPSAAPAAAPAAPAAAPTSSTGSSLNVQARNPLFVSTSKFPTWDD